MEPLAVSIDDAAKLIGISKHTVRAYEYRGIIKSVRIGTRVLIPIEEIKRLIREGCRSPRGAYN